MEGHAGAKTKVGSQIRGSKVKYWKMLEFQLALFGSPMASNPTEVSNTLQAYYSNRLDKVGEGRPNWPTPVGVDFSSVVFQVVPDGKPNRHYG